MHPLKRVAYPCRYADMINLFGKGPPHSLVWYLTKLWNSLTQIELLLINAGCLVLLLTKFHENVWGFIDGSVLPICRPKVHLRILYNEPKCFHALKFHWKSLQSSRMKEALLCFSKVEPPSRYKVVFSRCERSSTLFIWISRSCHGETSTMPT